jgi:hypothetical protein
VSEDRVLRIIFEPKRDEVTGEWKKLHNEELHILHSTPDIIRQMKSRTMRRDMWYTLEGTEKCTRFWWKSLKKRDALGDRGVDGRMGSE